MINCGHYDFITWGIDRDMTCTVCCTKCYRIYKREASPGEAYILIAKIRSAHNLSRQMALFR